MTRQLIGIDTSVLVRLVTGLPAGAHSECVERLSSLIDEGAEILASNQVIGETYIVLQHHYGATKKHARKELHNTLTSGLVSPLSGQGSLDALMEHGGAGLLDRLIAIDYQRAEIRTLTLDRKMASLPHAQLLSAAK